MAKKKKKPKPLPPGIYEGVKIDAVTFRADGTMSYKLDLSEAKKKVKHDV
ncbi:hypothetical protein [Aminobacter phage Erebus]|nr:hypothetical protein [Aminobacter phage Erebus]